MTLLRLYLLFGLVAHKTLWELLKRRAGDIGRQPMQPSSFRALAKVIRTVILVAVATQVVFLEILPISGDPFLLRAVGVALFTLGLILAMAARIELGSNWLDIEDARVQPHQELVASGIYRYVRHPIYTGDLLLLVGLELSLNSWLVLAVGLLIPVIVLRAREEERILSQAFPGYEAYSARTWRFVPFVV